MLVHIHMEVPIQLSNHPCLDHRQDALGQNWSTNSCVSSLVCESKRLQHHHSTCQSFLTAKLHLGLKSILKCGTLTNWCDVQV